MPDGPGGGTVARVRDPRSDEDAAPLAYASARGRLALTAVILGSGAAFLESSVVNVALPAMGRDLGLDLAGLQWVVNGYLLALSAFVLLGGSLGDRYGRRRTFVAGLVAFAVTSVACAAAPGAEALVAARVLQGLAAALLVPAGLAILEASFAPDDRGRAIGAWSGFSAVAAAVGPFAGGILVDAGSWRLVFLVVVVVAGPAALISQRALPETRDEGMRGRPVDWLGALLAAGALAAGVYALIEGERRALGDVAVVGAAAAAVVLAIAFLLVERRVESPMLPPGVFRVRQFSGANAATLANYFALGGAFFFVSLQLQETLGYSALEAGAAFFPSTLIMLVLSPTAGRLAQRVGPRLPMTVGPIVTGLGLLLLTRVEPGARYVADVLPAVIVFGIGLATFVAPLTVAVLAALPEHQAGIASAVSNAVARTAQLLAAAVLPLAAGLSANVHAGSDDFAEGFRRAMYISSGVSVLGGLLAFATIRGSMGRPPATPGPVPAIEPQQARG